MKGWAIRHVWVVSALVGVLCVILMLSKHVALAVALPDSEPAFRAGMATAPENKALLTLARELTLSVVVAPLLETLLLFSLPALCLQRLRGPMVGVLFCVLVGGIGWGLHGADVHAVGHGANFALLGAWFWTVMTALGASRALWATSLAHAFWNGFFLMAWILWGGR